MYVCVLLCVLPCKCKSTSVSLSVSLPLSLWFSVMCRGSVWIPRRPPQTVPSTAKRGASAGLLPAGARLRGRKGSNNGLNHAASKRRSIWYSMSARKCRELPSTAWSPLFEVCVCVYLCWERWGKWTPPKRPSRIAAHASPTLRTRWW